jgi:hypothetical protein
MNDFVSAVLQWIIIHSVQSALDRNREGDRFDGDDRQELSDA